MKKFIRNIIILGLISVLLSTGVVFFAFCFIFPQYSEGYDAALIDKVNRLNSIDKPKIILIGSSNLAYGMNSEKLEDEMEMPVVNMGLHGALGNSFAENEVKYNLNSGDIVVICHNSFGDDGSIEDTELAWITIENHFELWPLVGENKWEMVKAFPNYLLNSTWLWVRKEGNKSLDNGYCRSAFNKWGDNTSIRTESLYNFKEGDVGVPEVSEECILRLNELNHFVNEHGAKMLVAGFPIAYGEFTPSNEQYEEFQERLEEALDCDIISNYADYFIEYQYFHDTTLHLTNKGAEIRTDLLIDDLRRWMNEHDNSFLNQ